MSGLRQCLQGTTGVLLSLAVLVLVGCTTASKQPKAEIPGTPIRWKSPPLDEGFTPDPATGLYCQSTELDVEAGRRWTETGIWFGEGYMLSIEARGTIQYDRDGRMTGPEGIGQLTPLKDPNWDVKGLPYLGLVGRIGPDGPPFFVGRSYRGVAEESGNLWLGPNDCSCRSGCYKWSYIGLDSIQAVLEPEDCRTCRAGCYKDNSGAWTVSIEKCWR